MGHACEFETSMVMALRPELVRREQIKNDPPNDDPVLRGLYLAEDMKQRTDHGASAILRVAPREKGRKRFLDAADRPHRRGRGGPAAAAAAVVTHCLAAVRRSVRTNTLLRTAANRMRIA